MVRAIGTIGMWSALWMGVAHAGETWQAGVSKANITPREPMWLSGYASRTRPSEGTIHELWAKALAIQDAAGQRALLITLDLVGIDRGLSQEVCRRIEVECGLSREAIAICASHTHSGPVIRGNLAPIYNLDAHSESLVARYTAELADKIVKVASEAMERLQPAVISHGEGTAAFAVNRRNNPEAEVPQRRAENRLIGPVDHAVPVLAVRDVHGRLTAILGGYACHATVLDGYQWCGDWPGAAQLEIERRHTGATAMYWAGCGGDQNPLPRRKLELMEEYGRQFADAVDQALERSLRPVAVSLKTTYEVLDLPFGELPSRSELLEVSLGNDYRAKSARMLLAQLDREGSLPTSYPYPMQLWRLGEDLEWFFLGGEVVVDYALRIKSEFPASRCWVAGYSNDVMGYIPSRRVLGEGGYEGGESRFAYGIPAAWGPDTERLVVDAARKLHQLTQ